jgi:hypothetical protein
VFFLILAATAAVIIAAAEVMFSKWVGLWVFGFCPECNSDAPERDSCPVCHGYHWSYNNGPPSRALRKVWWATYKELNDTSRV